MLMDTKPLAEVRQDLSRFIEEAVTTHARFDITRNGKRAAVLLSADDYDALIETLDILSDQSLVTDIAHALVEADNGDTATHAQVLADHAERTNPTATRSAT